jgi:hypothetical protein
MAETAIDPLGLGVTGYSEDEGRQILADQEAKNGAVDPVELPCIHRQPLIEIGECDLCSLKGQPFEIFSCSVHGECSLIKRHSKVKSCLGCDDRQSALESSDPRGTQ